MIDPNVQTIAEQELTPNQLAVFQLWHHPMSQRAIALHLGLARTTVVDRYDAACLRLHRAGVRFDANGRPHLERCTHHVGCRAAQHDRECPAYLEKTTAA